MLEKGADPNAKDKDSWTPLHRATFEGHVEVVRLLLEHRADPTVKNILRKTPLDVARAWGHGEVVSVIEEWLRRGKRPPQQREAAETRPSGEASQKAVPLPTAQPPPTQPPLPHAALVVSSPPPVDVELVEHLSGEAVRYAPVSFSGPSFDVLELGLSGCMFLDVAPTSAYTVAC